MQVNNEKNNSVDIAKQVPSSKELLVGVISLGCDKNRVDTENMMTYLSTDGYTFTSDPGEADIIIINTCAFIKTARNESKDTIEEMLNLKSNGKCECLVVTGCYPQKYMNELVADYPEVDIFIGTNEYKELSSYLDKFFETKEKFSKNDGVYGVDCIEKGRVITTPSHYAYVRIADGCDNFCTYCTIPYIRGRFRSRKIESVVAETKDLVRNGAKEIILVAQDLSRYGIDIYKKSMLTPLIQKLSDIKGLEWIRLLYCYPENIDEDLIAELKSNPKLCKYIDIPFQHINDEILKRMNRKTSKEQIIKLITKLTTEVPDISIRTTFMLGFPGETNEQFKELLEFIKTFKLTNVGFFVYSKENGTVSARFEGQVDDLTKKRRLYKAIRVQRTIARQNNKNLIGRVVRVICEGIDYKRGLHYGRTEAQAPDIDTNVYFNANPLIESGQFYDILIRKVKGFDLYGEIYNNKKEGKKK